MKNTKKIISLVLAICMLAIPRHFRFCCQHRWTLLAALALRLLPCPAPRTAASAAIPQRLRCP